MTTDPGLPHGNLLAAIVDALGKVFGGDGATVASPTNPLPVSLPASATVSASFVGPSGAKSYVSDHQRSVPMDNCTLQTKMTLTAPVPRR